MRNSILLTITILLLCSCGGGSGKAKNTTTGTVPIERPALQAADDLSKHPGEPLYKQHCLACHQADGNGVPGMYPTLKDTEWVNGDNETLISIVLHGMDEEIEVNGEIFSTVMAPLPYLSNQQVVDVLNYVRKRFGSAEADITLEEVARVRAEG